MSNEEFKYWLLGFVLLAQDPPLNSKQISIIQSHANLAIAIDGALTAENQNLLDHIVVGVRLSGLLS
jgi:hypothetical protein